jgi:hypothetical protein
LGRRRLVLLLAVAALCAAPAALADGDPASDYLLSQATFVPPDDGIPAAYAKQLQATVLDAKARGYTIRVALIGTKYDLGSVPVLFKKPKLYARFLGQELTFIYKGRLLVVMPNGLGASRGGRPTPREQAVVDRLPAPGGGGAALASTATNAVVRLAADAGVVVSAARLGSSSAGPSTNRDRLTIAAAAIVIAAAAGAALLYTRRRGR